MYGFLFKVEIITKSSIILNEEFLFIYHMIPFTSSRLAEEENNKSEFIILFMAHSYGS